MVLVVTDVHRPMFELSIIYAILDVWPIVAEVWPQGPKSPPAPHPGVLPPLRTAHTNL